MTMPDDAPPLIESEGLTSPTPVESDWVRSDAGRLRCATWQAPQGMTARGTIVLAHGFSEHIEKYFEVVESLLSRGFAVAMFDWQGHGMSDAAPEERKEDFRSYDEGLAAVMEQKVVDLLPRPYIGLGHSMGGCLMCCAIHDHPEWFEACILSSPMLGVKALKQASFLPFVGKGIAMLPESIRQKINERKKFDGRFTSDKARYERHQKMIKANKHLLPRYDFVFWFNSMNKRLKTMRGPRWYKTIATPTLIILAGDENLVDNDDAISAASHFGDAELAVMEHAWHEMFMERDTIQLPLWASIDGFLDKHAPVASMAVATEPASAEQPAPVQPPATPPAPDKLVMK